MLTRLLALLFIIPPSYTLAGAQEKLHLLKHPYNGTFHFVNQTGAEIFTCSYAEDFSEGLALVSNLDPNNLRYGFIDAQAKPVIPITYFKAFSFSEGFAAVQVSEKDWMFIDKTGKDAFGKTFQDAQPFSNGFATVKIAGAKKYINTKGEILKNKPNETQLELEPVQNNRIVSFDENEKWGLKDSTGKVILTPQYDWIGPFSEGLAYAKLGAQGMYIDTKGAKVFSIGNLSGKPFENGLAMIGKMPPPSPDDEYIPWTECNYIDKEGKVLWKPKNELIERSLVITPADYDPKKKYPVLFIFPPTTQSATTFIESYVGSLADKTARQQAFAELTAGVKQQFILVCPPGFGDYRDHGNGFGLCIDRYDNYVKNELVKLEIEYSIDKNKMYAAGMSLGGDLSWALTQRNPAMFKGAIVMGSRCSHYKEGSFKMLAENKARFYFGMGSLEEQVRMKGSKTARTKLQTTGIPFQYYEIPEAGHEPLPLDKFKEALNFVMQ